jgi:hypothetical protein
MRKCKILITLKILGHFQLNCNNNLQSRPRDTLYPQELALTSPTIGGHSVGIVRLWTKGHGAKNLQSMWLQIILCMPKHPNQQPQGGGSVTTEISISSQK